EVDGHDRRAARVSRCPPGGSWPRGERRRRLDTRAGQPAHQRRPREHRPRKPGGGNSAQGYPPSRGRRPARPSLARAERDRRAPREEPDTIAPRTGPPAEAARDQGGGAPAAGQAAKARRALTLVLPIPGWIRVAFVSACGLCWIGAG